jgi:hypothetical protein
LPGETAIGTSEYLVVESDLPGPLTNVVIASGTDSQGHAVNGDARATVELDYEAALNVAKEPSKTIASVGDTVIYNFSVKNAGTVTVKGLTLTDDRLGNIEVDKDTLAPGETTTGSATYVVAESDLPGPLTNIVTASATDRLDKPVSAQARASVELSYKAALTLTKTPSPNSGKAGTKITYAYTVKNIGTVTLSELTLTDDRLGAITVDKDTLAPGETASGTATYIIKGTDGPGPVINNATAEALDFLEKTVSAKASASVTITRDTVSPVLECVHDNGDKTYTAFFGYYNRNTYPVTIPIGNNNKFTPKPEDQGQPTTFEPGRQYAVFTVDSDVSALVWHLDGRTATANINSQKCSPAPCGLEGPGVLCTNKVETYSYVAAEDPKFTYAYSWAFDGMGIGTGKSVEISGYDKALGSHTLSVEVTRFYQDRIWSKVVCSMDVKVIPEPIVDIKMIEE